ncbi:expressed unknown protein [Seminavis robusta]|uniref:Uncharacterized protein n=1 Tax=Seminavis robusta TaxID=568900 RepID=A0A9N8HE56_9STRA|nr:expressed unknown protein [Seminavis robusta]|eukprot:Sro457_g146930.1 n/a (566) ;mRNA; r:52135-53832
MESKGAIMDVVTNLLNGQGNKDVVTIALTAVGGLLVGGFISYKALDMWAKAEYERLLNNPKTECDIDAHVGAPKQNPVSALKVVVAQKAQLGGRQASLEAIPLECFPSPYISGLNVTRREGGEAPSAAGGKPVDPKDVQKLQDFLKSASDSGKKPIVVATIRMGFGHHRLAYSTVSWALGQGYPTIFHDLLNISSDEADLLASTDDLYSKLSRLSSEMGGIIETMLGTLLLQGDADALRVANLTAAHLQPLLLAYPKDIPIITTHQVVALAAVAAGFKNVVNLVVDNYPQWFLTVPKTKNMMQGPVNYQSFLRMGIKHQEVVYAGHWCPKEMVDNIDVDCQRRIARAKKGFGDNGGKVQPRRVLIPVGGAGAQKTYISNFLRNVADLVTGGKLQLFLNAGDHKHMKASFTEVLAELKLDYDIVDSMDDLTKFQENLLASETNEPKKAITLFAYEEYIPAVVTTDILCRVSDVLACKPSEMAFYCVPKLMLRRVGEHEAFSAKRASELGDGTVEAREVSDAREFLDLFLASPDVLVQMNDCIMKNNQIGIYSGCKVAVETVVQMAS